MSDQWTGSDDDLQRERGWLALLRESLDEADEVPPHALEAGYAAFSWRTIDAELARLTYDSAGTDALAGARSQQASLRAMTFASDSCTIELQVDGGAVLGQLIPADGSGTLTVTMRDSTSFTVGVDELGCFTIDPAPPGPFRLQLSGDASVVTDWVSL